ncbi:GMC oxidoreductase [Macrolepiota fuliginosa MF-IS2]|uniref:pyranose dehydrogenase (acceptor) n=1 Tax=Macrolepiota fuliginosa MF-IS2 TaxID=1400762 RepID=A0A9P6BZW5_9AGAR|nr:GMC oxidoreductase [Macrolepiota fuliginosa MF-IS2]
MRWVLYLPLFAFHSVFAEIFEDITQLPTKQYDFIIAGGGTAGLVVANRLTEDANVNVLVIEAGQSHQGVLDLEVPWLASRLRLAGAPFDWNTSSTAQSGLNGRSIIYARARVLGGSSSHNGMIWIRGSSDDYDKWAAVTGDEGWSWKEMLPYLEKVERWTTAPGHGSEEGDFNPRVHGFKGPLGVGLSNVIQTTDSLVTQTTKDLPDEFPFIEDPNAGRPIGIAWTQFSIANGTRSSAATAYLDPVLDRPNLSVLIGNYVTRILQTTEDSFRTVEFGVNQTSPRHQLTASKELILSAGVVGTPQILLNSGIGDPSELRGSGVQPVFDLPSVGKNFSTEPQIPFSWVANETFVNLNVNTTALNEALQEWIDSRTGPMTAGGESISAYFRLPDDSPALVGHTDPSAGPNTPHFGIGINANGYFAMTPDPTLAVLVEISEPASRGSIALQSTDPFELPRLDLAFYSAPVDIAIAKEAFKTAQRYVTAPAWKEFTLDRITPPPQVAADSDDLEEYIRNSTNTASHGIGTSAMSARGATHGVVDPDLTVKGISGLRIVDAGVIPFSPSANTQAPVYAVAERASDLIKKAWKLK